MAIHKTRWAVPANTSAVVVLVVVVVAALAITTPLSTWAKDHKSRDQLQKGQGLCIARFESTTGEPLYYTCPRSNESEKKSYCCYLDKCCDYKEFMKQTEQQFKMTQAGQFGYMSKTAIGGILKVLLYIVFFVILLIVGCCCLVYLLCRKRKLFGGTVFNTPLPAQPAGGVNIYQRPNQPYDMVESIGPGAAPAMPPPSYPAYPQPIPAYTGGGQQPPFNPNFK